MILILHTFAKVLYNLNDIFAVFFVIILNCFFSPFKDSLPLSNAYNSLSYNTLSISGILDYISHLADTI